MIPPLSPPTAAADADRRDRAWLAAAARGQRHAFEALYRHHQPRLARFLRRFTPRADLIDEVVNDTMWIVWSKAGAFRGDSRVGTWITGITYRCMLKALRNGPPTGELNESALGDFAIDDASDGGTPHVDRDLNEWVEKGLRTLPADQRATLELAYFLGHSCEEIAAIMECAVGTVKARMFHARVRLRSTMPALAGHDSAGEAVKCRTGAGDPRKRT